MNNLIDLASLFTKLGFIAFGGPVAHIAMLQKEVVDKRNWFSDDEFLEMISFTHLIPGPNSTEVALLIGYRRAKLKGLLVAGCCFILPAVLIVLGLTTLYMNFVDVPNTVSLFNGVRPVIAAIVTVAAIKTFKNTHDKSLSMNTVFIALIVLALLTRTIDEIQALFIGATYSLISISIQQKYLSVEPFSLFILFLTMMRIGSVLYGSGYVLISYLEQEFVTNLHWLDTKTLLNLVSIGEISPGPVFTTATSLGMYLGDLPGGILATLGIFTPSFLLIGFLYPMFHKLKAFKTFQNILVGINLVSLAIIIKTAMNLVLNLAASPVQVLGFLIAYMFIKYTKTPTIKLIVAGGLIGLIIQ